MERQELKIQKAWQRLDARAARKLPKREVEFYSEIGKKGGEARAEDKESLREAGRKGGQR